MSESVIQLRDIKTQFGEHVVHEHLNLDVYQGECVAIVGGSGSGKTTLLREILMLHTPNTGQISVLGEPVIGVTQAQRNHIRRRCGMMFQHGALFSSLSVLENVAFPLHEFTDFESAFIDEIAKLKIALVGLPPEAAMLKPANLSGGMIKRAAIARALALDPQLLFLDEPTAGLDPNGASSLDDLIIHLKVSLGLTVIMVTHDLDTLWRVTDRVAFLGDKRVLSATPMAELTCSDEPLIQQFFSGPRSRAAAVSAQQER